MDAETRTIVRAGLDASAYTAGAAQVAAANERIAQSSEGIVRTQEAAEGAARRKATAIDRLQASLDGTFRAQQQFERAQTTINAAVERGAITAQRAAELQQLAQQRYLGAGNAAVALAAANDNATRSAGRFGQAIGQAGFQVQDFAGQVMAGGNALVALGQQGSQLLGVFGTGGAIAGAALTVGILAFQLLTMGENSAEATRSAERGFDGMRRAADDLKKVIAEVNDLFLTQEQRAANARSAVIGELGARLRQQADIALQFQEESASQLGEAQRQLDAARRRMEQARREAETSRRSGGMAPQDELRNAEAALFTAQARLDGLNADIARQSRILGEVQARQRQLAEARTESPDDARRRAEAEQRERERREREGERAAEAARRDAERRAQVEEREAERARQAREREEERARQQREREEAAALERQRREAERTTDDIVRYGADAFADMFEANGRGWRGMLQTFEATFRQTFARIAAEAIIRPVVQPVVSGLIGQPGSDGTLTGGLTSMLGLSGLGSSLGGALGLGGLGASVSGVLATPLWGGTSGLSAGGLSGAGGLAALEASGIGAAGASGSLAAPTLGGVLGGIGAGFGAGMLLNSALGGNQTGGMVGSAGGAAAGALIGSIVPGVGTLVGGLIGGAAGGGLGGLFGPRGNRPGFFNVSVGAGADGMLGITAAGGKRADQQLAALRQQTEREIAQLNQVMASLGLRAEGGAMLGQNVGTNQAGSLGEAASRFRLVAQDARVQGAIDRAGGGLTAIGAAQQASELIGALAQITRAAEHAANPITAISRQFDGLREASARLGFGFEEVQAAQRRAIGAAIAPSIAGLADYARGLRTANDNSGNPLSRLAAAEADFSATASRAQSGDLSALGRLQQSAEQFRGLSRQVFGTGSGFADAESRIVAALESIGGLSSDQLTASVLAAETRQQTDVLKGALDSLQAEVARLRADFRQMARNPVVAA